MKRGPKIKSLQERYWSKVERTDHCWNWIAGTDSDGYGQIGSPKREDGSRTMLKSHRLAWEFNIGTIPLGLSVLHKCDNRRCCNPEHLFLGTCKDNNIDMWEKGRNFFQTFGNPALKVTDEEVEQIRLMRQQGDELTKISIMFDISVSMVSRICSGKRRKE